MPPSLLTTASFELEHNLLFFNFLCVRRETSELPCSLEPSQHGLAVSQTRIANTLKEACMKELFLEFEYLGQATTNEHPSCCLPLQFKGMQLVLPKALDYRRVETWSSLGSLLA